MAAPEEGKSRTGEEKQDKSKNVKGELSKDADKEKIENKRSAEQEKLHKSDEDEGENDDAGRSSEKQIVSELPTSPTSWTVSMAYKREAIGIVEFLENSICDLEFSRRSFINEATQSRITLAKPIITRAYNQEVELADTAYISGFTGQSQTDLTVYISSRGPVHGFKKALGLGVENITSGMVKDVSARLRSGMQGAVGTVTTASSNAEAGGTAKRILSRLSEGEVMVNSSYLQALILSNLVNILWANNRRLGGGAVRYNFNNQYCGNPFLSSFPSSCTMQAVDDFVSPFSTKHSVLVHIPFDNALEDVLTLGFLTSCLPNYVMHGVNFSGCLFGISPPRASSRPSRSSGPVKELTSLRLGVTFRTWVRGTLRRRPGRPSNCWSPSRGTGPSCLTSQSDSASHQTLLSAHGQWL